jgi:hypothetical protein
MRCLFMVHIRFSRHINFTMDGHLGVFDTLGVDDAGNCLNVVVGIFLPRRGRWFSAPILQFAVQ